MKPNSDDQLNQAFRRFSAIRRKEDLERKTYQAIVKEANKGRKVKKGYRFIFSPGVVAFVAICLMMSALYAKPDWLLAFFPSEKEKPKQEESIVLSPDKETMEWLFTVNHGEGVQDVGVKSAGYETLSEGVTSFSIYEQEFYLLDNVNNRIQVYSMLGEHVRTIDLTDVGYWFNDLLIDDSGHIHIITAEEKVILDNTGNVLERSEYKRANKLFPHEPSKETVSVKTRGATSEVSLVYEGEEMKFEIQVNENRSISTIPRKVFSNGDIVVEVLEFVEDLPVIMLERTLRVYTKDGELKGTALLNEEKFTESFSYMPNTTITWEENQFYYLAVLDDKTNIYTINFLENFESQLSDRVEKYEQQMEQENAGREWYDDGHDRISGISMELADFAGENTQVRGDYLHFVAAVDQLTNYLLALYLNENELLNNSYFGPYNFESFEEMKELYDENVDFLTLSLKEVKYEPTEEESSPIEIFISYQKVGSKEEEFLHFYFAQDQRQGMNDLSVFQ